MAQQEVEQRKATRGAACPHLPVLIHDKPRQRCGAGTIEVGVKVLVKTQRKISRGAEAEIQRYNAAQRARHEAKERTATREQEEQALETEEKVKQEKGEGNKKALVSLLILRPMYLLILLHQRRARLRVLLALKSLRFLLALLRGIEITGSGRRRRRRSPSSRALLRRASLLALLLRLRFLLARLRGIQITGRGGRRRRRRRPSNRALTSSTSLAATIGGGARRTTSGSLG